MLPPNFRKLTLSDRQRIILEKFQLSPEQVNCLTGSYDLGRLSDLMVESAIGTHAVPLGLATEFVIDGKEFVIPMATEEPSVILAASYAAKIVKHGGGFTTWADEPVMTAQVFLQDTLPNAEKAVRAADERLRDAANRLIPGMAKRGGGFRGMDVDRIDKGQTLCVSIHIDVRDAMGANTVNTVAEGIAPLLEELTGGSALLSILTNAALHRKAGASFSIPEKFLHKGDLSGHDVCCRIEAACKIADEVPSRAVTHNKGIMNGISALALATGNDTRAVEAGAHYYAQIEGKYKSLTRYRYEKGCLKGEITLPLALGTMGGATEVWPPTQLSLHLLGNPDSRTLCRIATSVGLAQNFAALFSLVTEGIQKGHMKLHSRRTSN